MQSSQCDHRWMREYPNGRVVRAECHYCGKVADKRTLARLDRQYQSRTVDLGFGASL